MRTYKIEYKYMDSLLEEQEAGCELVIPESYSVVSYDSPVDVLISALTGQWANREHVGYMRCECDDDIMGCYDVVCDVTYNFDCHKFWVEIRIIPDDSGFETPVTGFWVTLDASDLIVGR